MASTSPILRAILVGTAALAVAVPTFVVLNPPPPRSRAKIVRPARIVPPAVVPDVEPVKLQDLAPADAREFNAGVPFAAGPNPAARPFRLTGSTEDLARATDCLAAAGYYEAGDDAVGERAVVQVVLNRLRHPAFPKTICGVVFQGSERSTGCQFTFTCDGAMARTPSDAAWRRAREIARAALTGTVYRPVGYATHYHTDWVVPYWSASLDKIAELHTHLFFRWTGWWGTPPAFNRARVPGEPAIAALGRLSDAHKMGAALVEASDAIAEATTVINDTAPGAVGAGDGFLVRLSPQRPESYPAVALKLCGERPVCKVLGWTGAAPTTEPLTPSQLAAMSFSYLRDRTFGLERTLWNCVQFKSIERNQCMKRDLPPPVIPSAAIVPPPVTTTRGPVELDGVRRKPAPAPRPTPAPVTPPGTSPAATP